MTPLSILGEFSDNHIYIKRDDLLPFSFGGNKVRIAQQFVNDMYIKEKNCIIGYGNARSNLSRALSNLCASKGIPCHIISPADEDGTRIETANSKLVNNSFVKFHQCTKANVAETVCSVIAECQKDGYDPYYIYGDKFGKGNESVPVQAYYEAYSEINQQAQELEINFDYIFLATGTGMTQSGLIAGRNAAKNKEKIIGISIARNSEQEKKVLYVYLDAFKSKTEFDYSSDDVNVVDDYLSGGYGLFNSDIENMIIDIYRKYGIPLDPTYSGKAFTGMVKYLKEHEITGKNILFLHTGGTPLFFDYINALSEPFEVTDNVTKEQLMEFLHGADKILPTRLSDRVDIAEYAEKIMKFGNITAVLGNDKILSAALFYCNDEKDYCGYLTLLATLPEATGKGYGRKIMHLMEKYASGCGMKKIKLETDFSNKNAVAFYSKCGYRVDFVSDKVHMVKEI